MANEIVIPRLGWSMEEGTFGEWLKQDGQTVELGEPLFVLEGEKSAQDIEAVDRGILRIPAGGPKPGDTVRVGQVIGFVIKPGESLPEPVGAGSDQPAPPAQLRAEFRVSPQDSSHLRTFPGAAASASPLAPASPRARRAARERGVDLALVPGGGITGRIRERDVVAATAGRPSAPGEAPRSGEPAGPLSVMRRTIAARMLESSQTTAAVTLQRKCDASNLVNLRNQFRAGQPERDLPSYTDLLIKLVGQVLVDFPEVRTQWRETELAVPQQIDLAVAVDTAQGLLAPVLRGVDRMTLRQVSAELRRLTAEARAGRLPLEALRGAVFTITNLGAFDVEWFTPIINLPQSAILGVGRISREAVVRDDQIVVRDQIPLSLTFDHRVLDGAPAARFLAGLARAIENPGPRLVT